MLCSCMLDIIFIASFFFFFNDTATTEIYTLSLHDALPICCGCAREQGWSGSERSRSMAPRSPLTPRITRRAATSRSRGRRSEEHTSELQSQFHLVCRLLLEKKKKKKKNQT